MKVVDLVSPYDEKSLFSRFRMIEEQECVSVMVLEDKLVPLIDLQKYNRRQTEILKGRMIEEEQGMRLLIHEI